jgi:O-methyltransferase
MLIYSAAVTTEAASKEERARERRRLRDQVIVKWIRSTYDLVSLPITVVFLFYNRRIPPKYGMTWRRKFSLAFRMYRNTKRIMTGTSYKAHLAMAAKLLETSPKVRGVVVECGCWRGGSTANLSLVCEIVGRKLIVYDTFAGLPEPEAGDKYAYPNAVGYFRGDLEVVKDNVRLGGCIDVCEFRKGLFKDTLPHHTEPVVLSFLDVDYQASLHDCVLNLWPHLTDKGYMFIDEYTRLDYCGIFYSERYWREFFDRPPPGIMGAGVGVGVGQFYLGPYEDRPLIQGPTSVAYTRKDFYGMWDYYPAEDRAAEDESVASAGSA